MKRVSEYSKYLEYLIIANEIHFDSYLLTYMHV